MRRKTPKLPGPTRYRPIRIVNPQAEFVTAPLLPCQSLRLVLAPPQRWGMGNVGSKAKFNVELISDFFILESCNYDKRGDQVFFFSPKFDLTDWTSYGEVALGNIKITLTDNDHINADKLDYESVICLNQLSAPDRGRILTVINPHNYIVKMESHQILESVCFVREWNDWEAGRLESSGLRDEWESNIGDLEDAPLELYQLRAEITGDRTSVPHDPAEDATQSFPVKNRFNLKINPRLREVTLPIVQAELDKMKPPCREHHWWFGLTKESIEQVRTMPDDTFPCSVIEFSGSTEGGVADRGASYTAWKACKVVVEVRGKTKNKIKPSEQPTTVEAKFNVSTRREDRSKSLLINPFSIEQVHFYVGNDSLTVEIAQPDVFWSDLTPHDRWSVIEEKSEKLEKKMIDLKPLDPVWREGKIFQRFRIDNKYDGTSWDTKWIGAVSIICKNKMDHHDGCKRLSVWFTPVPENDKKIIAGTKSDLANLGRTYGPPRGSQFPSGYGQSYNSQEGYYTRLSKHYCGSPKVADVKLELVNVENLEDSASTIKMCDVTLPLYEEGEHWLCDPKKKGGQSNSEWSSYTPNCHVETNGTSTSGKTNSTENDETRNTKTSSSDGSGTTSRIYAVPRTGSPAAIFYNPDHTQQLVVEYGKDLTLRVNTPRKLLDDSKISEKAVWVVEATDARAIAITKHENRTIGNVTYQEVGVKIQKEMVPFHVGAHPCGAIRFLCEDKVRVCFVLCKVTEKTIQMRGAFQAKPEAEMFNLIPLQKLKEEEKRTAYVYEWKHRDGVIIDPDQHLYLRCPKPGIDWKTDRWQIEIEQYPLPQSVWNLLKECGCEVNQDNPWFNNCTPLNLNNVFMIRPMISQQPNIDKIIKSLSREFNREAYLIATLRFRLNKHQDSMEVRTDHGVISSQHTMYREFGLYLSLKPKTMTPRTDKTSKIVTDPPDKTTIRLEGSDKITISLGSQFVGESMERGIPGLECPYYTTGIPSFLDFEGVDRTAGRSSFKFRVKAGKGKSEEGLTFVSKANLLRLQVAYQP